LEGPINVSLQIPLFTTSMKINSNCHCQFVRIEVSKSKYALSGPKS